MNKGPVRVAALQHRHNLPFAALLCHLQSLFRELMVEGVRDIPAMALHPRTLLDVGVEARGDDEQALIGLIPSEKYLSLLDDGEVLLVKQLLEVGLVVELLQMHVPDILSMLHEAEGGGRDQVPVVNLCGVGEDVVD